METVNHSKYRRTVYRGQKDKSYKNIGKQNSHIEQFFINFFDKNLTK